MNVSYLTAVWRLSMMTVLAVACFAEQASSEDVSAFTEPYRDIDVAASEMGTLAAIHVKEGDQVTAGQLLGQLDDDVLQASLKMAETGMNSRGKLNSVLAELRLQIDRLGKLQGLRERQHASQQEVDRTKAQKEIAEANLEAVQDELKIKTLERQRILAELQRRRLSSPIDGVVTVVYKDVGEFISASDPMVVKVVQLNPLLVLFSVPMDLAQRLDVDTPVSLAIADRTEPVIGQVEFISPTADAQSSTVRVKVRIPNPDGQLPCGAACRLQLADQVPTGQPGVPEDLTGVGSKRRREVAHRDGR